MTDTIAELRELLAKATKRPWRCFDSVHGNSTIAIMKGDRPKVGRWQQIVTWAGFDGTDVGKRYDRANQELIVAAVNAVPELIAEIESLREEVRVMRIEACGVPASGEAVSIFSLPTLQRKADTP